MALALKLQPAFEEYSECIFELAEDNIDVIQARIAERLNVSRPAVSGMVARMHQAGLVTVVDGSIRFTESGQSLAEQMVRRHRLAERFLTDVLSLSWAEAHHEAGRWKRVINGKTETAITEMLGHPTTCPHGNPIPGSSYEAPNTRPLVTIAVGQTFSVSRIPELLEFAPGMLEFLEDSALIPGGSGRVEAVGPDGTMTLDVGGVHVAVGTFAGQRILVTLKLCAK